MASKKVETLRTAHEHWNRRDFAGVIRNTAEGFYTDNARGLNLKGRDKFREWTEAWAPAFSDARIMNPEYIDAGDIVIAWFTGEGTNDGPLGSLKPTGRRMTLPFCEICHFDQQGQIVSGSCYYDPYTLLTQLGPYKLSLLQPRTPARKAPPFREARSPAPSALKTLAMSATPAS
jgi:predicted ester cyclase